MIPATPMTPQKMPHLAGMLRLPLTPPDSAASCPAAPEPTTPARICVCGAAIEAPMLNARCSKHGAAALRYVHPARPDHHWAAAATADCCALQRLWRLRPGVPVHGSRVETRRQGDRETRSGTTRSD
jgi:hypothetical protein